MRAATALTANEASARCSVTRASISACVRAGAAAAARPAGAWSRGLCSWAGRFHNGRSVTCARAAVTPFFSAGPGRLGTALCTFPVQLEGELRRFGLSRSSGVPMAAATKDPPGAGTSCPARRRKGGGLRGLPAPVDAAVAGAGAPGPAAVQGRGEAVPDPHPQDPVACAHRARDRGGPRPAPFARGRAGRRHGGHRRRPGHRRQPLAPAGGRGRPRPVERPLRQTPRGAARPGDRPAQPVRHQPRAHRGWPGRHRRRAAVGSARIGRHLRLHRPHRRWIAPRGHAGRCPVSGFSTLNTARTALSAQQRGIDVTGQNIANVNTDGYSRQRADLQAIGGSTIPAFYSKSPGIGQGVDADQVTRIRDAFLEGRAHQEYSTNARLTAENDSLELVEQAFREPGDTGVQSLLSKMWAGWGDVANQPQDLAARSQVLQRLETLVGGLHASQSSLDGQWNQTRENLDVVVSDVNAAATSIAELNRAIKRANQSEMPANELTDRRDSLVMKLAESVGATVRQGDFGVVDVVVGGMTLVAGSTANLLKVAGSNDPTDAKGTAIVPPVGAPRIVTATGGYGVQAGGKVAGQLNTLNS